MQAKEDSAMEFAGRLSGTLAGLLILIGVACATAVAQPVVGSRDGLPTLAPMLKTVTPGVVNIAVEGREKVEVNPLLQDPFFRQFFGIPDLPTERRTESVGSGVVVDAAKGLVLTNHHVIRNAMRIVVTLKDGRRLDAKLVGSDAATEIALLKIEPQDLSAVAIGNSDQLEVGDYVVAIGNPFGLGQTVTSGIVSALGRSGLRIQGYEDFIQTDAPINPGNSGGALVNLRGELVGINTAIIGPSGGNVGIGFAVPVNMARAVMEQLLAYGEVRRGRLGIAIQDLTPDLKEALRVPVGHGAVVTRVDPNSPAETAGLKSGDVIVAVDGRAIESSSALRNAVGVMPIGYTVVLIAYRGAEKLEFRAKISKGA
jgi:Do/DeqQ family serine protease